MPRLLSLLAVALTAPAWAADPASAEFFESRIRPALIEHCYPCHSAEAKTPKAGLRLDTRAGLRGGGDSGPAVVPGKPGESRLVKAVRRADGVPAMPPKKPLPAAVVADLEAWVAAGAPDPRTDAAAALPTGDHWAFKPITRPPVPGPGHPIDAFVRAKLREKGLSPNPEADRVTLLRRLTFDLTGLPPTPAEVDAFRNDASPDAYEKVVDRLLASPGYGERWARHWLDGIRFAESHGFEMNQPRPNAWRYRDWVIRAFNDDKPFDRFVTEQLAGDALGADEATGFLVAGPWDQVKSPDPVLTAQQRADELNDVVSVTGSAFLGLTVGCARCHAHKFDPVTQTDYHALVAVFAGVQHGDRPLPNDPSAKARKALAEKLRAERDALDRELAKLEPLADPTTTFPRRAAVNPARNVERFPPVTATAVRFTVQATSNLEPCLDELEVFSTAGRNVALGAKPSASGTYPNSDIHRLEHINDGRYGNSRSWISNQFGKGWVQLTFPAAVEIDRVVWGRDREGKFTDRLPTIYRIEVRTAAGWVLVASSDDRAAVGQAPSAGLLARMLTAKRTAVEAKLREAAAPPAVYAGKFTAPEPVRRFHRGDPMQPREPVAPGALAAVGPKLALTDATPEQQRRLALAKWLTAPENPLTPRVIANRVWHYHFGTGIVDTPSDFGRNGGKPTHPELLDWLASELREPTKPTRRGGWALKPLHKLIVTSATYKQSSRAADAGLRLDAADRLLWRYPPRRLEAEALRDAVLAVSGQLDRTPGGPGFDLFEPNANYVKVYTPKREFGPDTFRRMVYWAKPRMQVDDTFGAFDCPDAGQIAPKRTASTTPLQALNLLNSPFMLQQAGFFAERLKREAGSDVSAPVKLAFRLAFQREATPDEARAAIELVKQHGLPALCRALFNANEFVFVD